MTPSRNRPGTICRALFAILVMNAAPAAHAVSVDENGIQTFDLDVSYKIGIASGTIKKPRDGDKPEGNFSFYGLPFTATLNQEVTSYATFYYEGEILLDIANNMITRKSFAGGACLHMLGGSRRAIEVKSVPYVLITTHKWNISACNRASYFLYSAANKDDLSQSVDGATFEDFVGTQLRYEPWEGVSVGFEFMVSVYGVPATSDRISSKSQELKLLLRTFI